MKLDALNADAVSALDARRYAGERMRVRVRALRVEAEVGVYESERGRRQPLVFDVEAEVAEEAVHPDGALGQAVNYAAIAELIRRIATSKHHELLEDLAREIADATFADARVRGVALSIDKPEALEDAGAVGVTYERWR